MRTAGCEPLLKWAVGKRRLLRDILLAAPKGFRHYYEPFLGGGAVFFSLLPASATLSDANPELINTYTQVRDNIDGVIRCLRRMANSEVDYYKIRASCPRTAPAQAARLIYLCTLSFNGIYRQNLLGKFNVPYGHKIHLNPCDEPKLRRISENLQGRHILVNDFEVAVSRAKRGDLVYFDPPYTVAHGNNGFVKYNAKIFSWSDQKRLAALAHRLKANGCRVLISNAEHPSIRELYAEFRVHTIHRYSVMSAASEFRRPVRECLFS